VKVLLGYGVVSAKEPTIVLSDGLEPTHDLAPYAPYLFATEMEAIRYVGDLHRIKVRGLRIVEVWEVEQS
jgi:hypothetical protein